MCERVRQAIAFLAVGGYLLTVTAALPLHRCESRGAVCDATATPACLHCHEVCQAETLPAGDPAASDFDAADRHHAESDCYVCQVLAQKCLLGLGPDWAGWAQLIAEPPVAAPRPAVRTPTHSWSIRAPPCSA